MRILKKNKTKADCGVVAAFNTASWCNRYKPYGYVEYIARSCGFSPKKGIFAFQFSNLLNKLEIPAKKISPKSITELENKLNQGKFIILFYIPTGFNGGHVITAFVNQHGDIKIINPDKERRTWYRFKRDIMENGVLEFNVWEVPARVKRVENDVA